MKKKLSDEQLDQMMRIIMNDAALDDATVNEVADSPTLWWSVQRQINQEKEVDTSPWPPVGNFWRWMILAVPAAAAAAVLITLFAFQPSGVADDVAVNSVPAPDETVRMQPKVNVDPSVEAPFTKAEINRPSKSTDRTTPKFVAAKHTENRRAATKQAATSTVAKKSAEIKTDFIALSYARNPESGQIIRVKVPSSMMVTLGLVASVEKPSNLIDAQVIVGDDGLTRAIRFIR